MSHRTASASAASLLVAMCFCLVIIPQGSAQSLKSLISLSQVLAAKPPNAPIGNFNIIEDGNDSSKPIPLCYFPYLSLFVRDGKPYNSGGSSGNGYYNGLAAISLALEHLNTGNGTIVPDLDGINQRCPLRFFTDSFDSEAQEAISVNQVISLTDRGEGQMVPCAILSATRSSISIATSVISSLRGFPEISALSTSTVLDNKEQYKLFGRTLPNDDGTSIPLLAKLNSWNVNHIAILHMNDAYGNAFADDIRVAAQTDAPGLSIVSVPIKRDADNTTISNAIQQLKASQCTYFFGIIFPTNLVDRVMTEAYNQGVAGTGSHTWLFSDSLGSTVTSRSFPVGSPLEKAYLGTGILQATGGVPGTEAFDKLTLSMQQLKTDEHDLAFLNDHLPRDYPEGKSVNHSEVTSQETFLSSPGFVAPYLYDAAVGLGLAACELTSTSEPNEYFTGEELFQAFVQREFEGTSGSVVLDPTTGSRNPRSALFSLTNFVVDEDAGQGMVQFKGVDTDLFKSGQWESLVPYTFNDATHAIPLDLPALETDPNHLSTGFQVLGLILCGIIVGLSIIFACWTYRNRGLKVVRASQPIFLYLIASGTLLMGLAIIPATIDLGDTNQKGADAACMAFPWLLTSGFSLTFSALFTKTYRINQVMKSAAKFKRIKLTALDVMKPMTALLFLNIVVLTVWTVIDPLQREHIVVAQDAFLREIETYAVCSSDHAGIFLAILCVINLGSLVIAVIQAYQARNISTELSESAYIFRAMWIILYVSFLAIPVLVIARDKVEAYYFVTAGLIFVICSSILLLIFVPKVLATRKNNPPETSFPARWRMMNNEAPEEEREEEKEQENNQEIRKSNGMGIQILSSSAKAELEKEVYKLKSVCMMLSRRQGLNYNSLINNGTAEQIPIIEGEDIERE
mmetsp:Transcript_18477/g.39971  ORF Transcript_18477/g.39971 Transcript_18477/m.39971 type:complete len:910 (+) Transcript_18477:305-3034(+)